MADPEAVEDAMRMLQELPDDGSFCLTLYSESTGHNASLGVGDHGDQNTRVQLGLLGLHVLTLQDLLDGSLQDVLGDAGRMATAIGQNPGFIQIEDGDGGGA